MRSKLLKDISTLTKFGKQGSGDTGDDYDYADGTDAREAFQINDEDPDTGLWQEDVNENEQRILSRPASRSALRMAIGMDFDDERYTGKKISRGALRLSDGEDDEEEHYNQTNPWISDEINSSKSSEGSDSNSEEDKFEEYDGLSAEGRPDTSSEDEDDVRDEDEFDEETSAHDDSDTNGSIAESESDLDKEMERIRQDKKGISLLLKRSRDEQQDRANQAKCHQEMWNRLLEVRILLQRLQGVANRLPRGESYRQYCHEDRNIQENLRDSSSILKTTLSCLLAMREEQCLNIEPKGDEKERRNGKKRCVKMEQVGNPETDAWLASQDDYMACRSHWREVLDSVHQRATLSTAISKKFRVINQGLWQQIEASLMDRNRALKKSHLLKSETMGQNSSVTIDTDNNSKSVFGGIVEEEEDDEEEVDREAFDDSDLYQQMLQDYIQYQGQDLGLAASASGSGLLRRKRTGKKKQVDTKASKGRKLRYVLHPKLEHFMFPVPCPPAPIDIDRLFSSLPGRLTH